MKSLSTYAALPEKLLKARRLFAIGQIAKGMVYMLVGLLSIAALIGIGQGIEGPSGTLRFLSSHVLGRLLVALLGIGLAAYSYWRFYRALVDPADEGMKPLSLSMRIGYACSGSSYLFLVFLAIRSAIRGPASSQSSSSVSKQGMVSTIMQLPWGQYLLMFAALSILAVAIYQAVKAIKLVFLDTLEWQGVDERKVAWAGRIGLVARTIVFAGIAWFVFQAARQRESSEFRSTEGILEYLGQSQYGWIWVSLAGIGLLLYGYFCYLKGRYAQLPAFLTTQGGQRARQNQQEAPDT